MNQRALLKILQLVDYTPLPWLVKPIYEGMGFILLFHNISPSDSRQHLKNGFYQRNVPPEKLESIILYLKKKKYSFISLDELYELLAKGRNRKKVATVTLDDGMLDNYQFAWPVFRKYSVPFTIYVPTKFIGSDEILWTIPLEQFLIEKNEIELSGIYGMSKVKLNTNKQKDLLLRELIRMTEEKGSYDNLMALFAHNNWYDYKNTARSYMNWDEVAELSRDELCTIGSHTVNHLMLSKLPESDAIFELAESKRIIESHINKPVYHLGYPYGTKVATGQREFLLAEKCGYTTATTVRYANIHPEHGNFLHCLPRYTVKPDFTNSIFDLIIKGAFQFLLKKGKRVITV